MNFIQERTMQTYLPSIYFDESATMLDWRRLGNQRKEARQVLTAIQTRGGWFRHPAVQMWIGYEAALIEYGNVIILEWEARDYRNNMPLMDPGEVVLPPWLGDERVHSSHRANLLRKDPEWYGRFGWSEEPAKGYFWPTKGASNVIVVGTEA